MSNQIFDLTGKTALVTGASRGIGRATALALAKAGAQVLVHYGRGADEAKAVVKEIRDAGGRAEALGADCPPRRVRTTWQNRSVPSSGTGSISSSPMPVRRRLRRSRKRPSG